MTAVDENLEFAIHQVERVLADQLTSVQGLSNKAGTLLGFILASFAAMFALSRDALQARLLFASAAASLLTVAAGGLAFSYRLTTYQNPPKPDGLLLLLARPPPEVKRRILATMTKAFLRNEEVIARRFQFLNLSLTFFILGVLLFIAGVVMA